MGGGGRSGSTRSQSASLTRGCITTTPCLQRSFPEPQASNAHTNKLIFSERSKESIDLLGQMRTAIANSDMEEAGRLAHQLKGTVVYLGARPAADAVRQFEQAALSFDLKGGAKAIEELEHQVDLLKRTLTSHATKPEDADRDHGNP
ncbi:MAG: Hpt domain-containing protein [Thermoguttaceae bacterium]